MNIVFYLFIVIFILMGFRFLDLFTYSVFITQDKELLDVDGPPTPEKAGFLIKALMQGLITIIINFVEIIAIVFLLFNSNGWFQYFFILVYIAISTWAAGIRTEANEKLKKEDEPNKDLAKKRVQRAAIIDLAKVAITIIYLMAVRGGM